MTSRGSPQRFAWILLAAAFIAIWIANLENRKLVRPDEGRYAEIAREMVATGDWITPRLNGVKYFEKPPLQYWATATAFRLFGEHHWTARLWPALTGLGVIALVFFAGRRLFGQAAGLYAALVLGGSAGHIALSHMNNLDMGLTFFLTAALLAFLMAQDSASSSTERRNWNLVAWACAALAVLSKGLIGIVLPAAGLAAYALIQRNLGLLRGQQWIAGGALFLAISAPWLVLVQRANPEFATFFFVHEHFARYLTEVHHRIRPWWYFFPVLAVGIVPWLTLLPRALIRGWRSEQPIESFQPARFLLIWAIVIFAFFSASGSKLPSYIIPVLPALALLIGRVIAETEPRRLLWHAVLLVVAGLAVMVIATVAALEAGPAAAVTHQYAAYIPWIAGAGAAYVIGGSCAVYACRTGNRTAAALGMAFGGLVAIQLVTAGHDTLARSYSGYQIARDMKPFVTDQTPIYSVRTYDQTLPFYLKRTVTLVAFKGELAYGLEHEPQGWLPEIQDFERAWRKEHRPLAIMEPHTYGELKARGLPMRIVARDLRQLVVTRPDAAR